MKKYVLTSTLPKPKKYYPVSKNPFSFSPGLSALSEEENIFQIDSDYSHYIKTKCQNKKKSIAKFIQKQNLDHQLELTTIQFLISQLTKDWPDYFNTEYDGSAIVISNKLNDEIISFNNQSFELIGSNNHNYIDAIDALVSQLQEDMSIVSLTALSDHISYLHLCFPNFWSAEDKIGQSFVDAHKVTPGMGKIKKNHQQINHMLASSGPYERFTWGLTTNNRLSQHPLDDNTQSRQFDQADDIYLRIERQVTVPLPENNAYLFFIRTYFENTKELNDEERNRLITSLDTMPGDIASYKGVTEHRDLIINRLISANTN